MMARYLFVVHPTGGTLHVFKLFLGFEFFLILHNPGHVGQGIRNMSATDSGRCRPLFEPQSESVVAINRIRWPISSECALISSRVRARPSVMLCERKPLGSNRKRKFDLYHH